MDLVGLVWLLGSVILSFIFATGLGIIIGIEREEEKLTVLGFSGGIAGYSLLCTMSIGFSLYSLLTHFQKYNLNHYYLIAYAVIVFVFITLFVAMGINATKKNDNKNSKLYRFIIGVGEFIGTIITYPAKIVFKTLKYDATPDVTEEDILNMVDTLVEDCEDNNHLTVDKTQKEMISAVFELDDIIASDIMTHRTDIISIDENATVNDIIQLTKEKGISRLPVHSGSIDEIIGIIYVKDLLSIINTNDEKEPTIKDFIRTVMYVPESCVARQLLVDFKTKHTQIAIVVDAYGGTSGLVTMEDILEEIVGNIQDEFDNEDDEEIVVSENGIICDASIDLEDIFDAFSLPMPELNEDIDEDFDTISGLITQKIGRIPNINEEVTVEWGNIIFKVVESNHKRILKVNATPNIDVSLL